MTLPDKNTNPNPPPPFFKVFRETNKINSKQTIKKKSPQQQQQHNRNTRKISAKKKNCIPETEGCAIRTNDRFPFVR
jgi:hypothetical protein